MKELLDYQIGLINLLMSKDISEKEILDDLSRFEVAGRTSILESNYLKTSLRKRKLDKIINKIILVS